MKSQVGSTFALISEKTGKVSHLKKGENGRWKKDPGFNKPKKTK